MPLNNGISVFFQQVHQFPVRFRWPLGRHEHGVRVEVPLVGMAKGTVRQGRLHKGHIVEAFLPSGIRSSFFVVGLYWNEINFGDVMLLLSSVYDASEYLFAVIIADLDD